ncbi:MAG: molybdenum cofactor biosynthesis protein MoaE [Bauldia sp.]
MAEITVRIHGDPFEIAAEVARLHLNRGIGAIVTFTGVCRDEGGRLSALELEHYPGMTEAEVTRIANEAAERWSLIGLTIVHRVGKIAVGDDIVLVAAAATHRDAAFAAAGYVMDFLKTRAPFWKKEHPAGDWVAAKGSDDEAAKRWRGNE